MSEMSTDGLKVVRTRFEGRGHINIAIERCIDTEDPSVPVACRIHISSPNDENPIKCPDDTLWLDDISDLEVLHDAIGGYILMMKENERRKGGDHGQE